MSNRANRTLGAIIAIVVVAAVMASVFGSRSAKQLDRGTPPGIVQAYLTAVLSGRNDIAIQYLSEDTPCQVTDLDRAYINSSVRVSLLTSRLDDDHAIVRVSVETPAGGPFETFKLEEHSYRLVQEGRGWRISGIPWPLWDCGLMYK